MRLRKIEISGFKSFMSRLEMEFSGGITAILGPNGCGKSNVVDAIRWVLGEQRSRLLRNTKMENVLFNGTRTRKPLGMAEVFLTLSNDDRGLSVDYEEVTIGRRLFRSGASDYLLNGEDTRLKSLRGLLVDTGLGNNAYSIIEREMVERVLSEKEQDKRNLLEEAAGVMRYRIQREEAIRKIKLTEQDLLRLDDIIQELDKEIRSLKYQMAKARRYTRLKEKADAMETTLLKASLHELLEKGDELKHEREKHEGIRLADDNEILLKENKLQETRIRLSELERELQQLREKRYDLSTSLQRREEKIAVHTERIASHKARTAEDESEVERAREKLVSLAEDLARYGSEDDAKRNRLEALQDRLCGEEELLRDVSRGLGEIRGVLRDKKQLALDLVKEKAKEKGLHEHIAAGLAELQQKRLSLETQIGELSEEESRRVEELSAVDESAGQARAELSALEERLAALAGKLDGLGAAAAGCEDEYSGAARIHTKLTEKKEFLERIKQEHTRWSVEALGCHDRLTGVLSDFVRVEKKYRKCIEACLAPVLNSFVTGSRSDAVGCLDELRAACPGKVQLVYPDRAQAEAGVVEGAGVVGPAASLIDADPRAAACLDSYLAGVVVVENVETAREIMDSGRASRVATLDGVFFDGTGRITVSGTDDIELTILEYDAKLNELSAALDDASRRVNELEERRRRLLNDREAVQSDITRTRAAAAEKEKRYEDVLSRRRDAELAVVRVKEKITAQESALEETGGAISRFREKLENVEKHLGEHEDDSQDDVMSNRDLAELEERAVEKEREKEKLAETVGKLRLENVTLAGEVETLRTKIRNAEKLDEELRQLIQAREEDAARCREQITLSEEDVAGLRTEIAGLHGEKELVEKDIDAVTESYDAVKQHSEALEGELKTMKNQRDAKRENLERVSVETATLETRISALLEKAQEKFNQDLSPYLKNRGLFDPAEWAQFDRGVLADLRTQIESYGPVNMLALEEYNEKKERFDFLSGQRNDLEEAKASLAQAIRRINREARRLLRDTFVLVRENFRQTFFTLFDGGEADLLFVDSEDPLEANIKIVANPKGKKLHDISSLSSGERALVALSLLFGIYLVKPSPFCVFDEVDAPLDDANIARFVRLLKSFTDRMQFIVITHNKKTMEAADNLYGVTMEEPGVSKLISVHLDEAERFRRHQPHIGVRFVEESTAPVHA